MNDAKICVTDIISPPTNLFLFIPYAMSVQKLA